MFKIFKKICAMITITSIILSAIGTGLYFFFRNNNKQLTLKGINEENIMFFELNNNDISYNILNPTNNNTGYLLTRFFKLDSDFILTQTLLDNNYLKISKWDNLNLNLQNNDISIIENNNVLNIDIDNIMLDIEFSNNIPTKINNYTIVNYNFNNNLNDPVIYLLKNIINPNLTELSQNQDEVNILLPPTDIDPKCLLSLSYKAMTSGNNLVAFGNCNGYSSIGIPGTNFENPKDIIADIKGALDDNYKTGFNNLKNFDKKKYDFCAGYSLGGAIAKYMSLNNYCKNIITFGTPLTQEYNYSVPIIQYINSIDDEDGCCKRDWLGFCKENGMFLVDPVTLILKGKHENMKYIGNRKNNKCIGNFAYTVWKQKFNLHLISTYENNLNF